MATLQPPKGTDDIIPPASRVWRRVLRTWEDWAERFGYGLVMTPIFEATEVFERGVGESSEVVRKQMYTFEDGGGRSLTLRPEATASTVRAYLASGVQGAWKVAYSGPMFRYERPQKGRRRQFYQVGAEHLGSDDPSADAAMIELGFRFLTDLGIPGVVVQVNSLGDQDDRPAYLALLRAWLAEREQELCEDSREAMRINPMRVLDCKVCAPLLGDAPVPTDHLSSDATAAYTAVKDMLRAVEVPFEENSRLVRGLDYYTRTAFEYVASEFDAAQNALGGGGRYDGLAEAIGGRQVSGVGFAMGIDRIILAMGEGFDLAPLDVFVVSTSDREREAYMLLSRLRRAGWRVEASELGRSVKAQFKAADRSGAPKVIVVGDEWESGDITARDMSDGTQRRIPREEIETWLGQ